MTPELQTVIDRLELVERQNGSLRLLSLLALLVALGAIAVSFLVSNRPDTQRARYSVVEANRFLLRDLEGRTAGGMEVSRGGTIRLVLGRTPQATGSAFLEVQENGVAHLTLRGPDGGVRAAVLGSSAPSVSLSPQGQRSSAALVTLGDGSGSLFLIDAMGRTRFRVP